MVTDNINISDWTEMITPEELKELIPSNAKIEQHVEMSREIIAKIVQWDDNRLIAIVGPCSIHNPDEWLEYAKRLAKLKETVPNLFIVMRSYFEKPRTTVGWKWLINDPDLDWSFDINKWIQVARKFIMDVNNLWLAAATEFLDNMTPADIADWVSWWAIWARTTESQPHREMASGLSMPIWFKNSTKGDIQIAIDAINSSSKPHSFLWINDEWKRKIFNTTWNPDWHIILRGWKNSEWKDIRNFDEASVSQAIDALENAEINTWAIIDCSHANSKKDHNLQAEVCSDVAGQIAAWNKKIVWVMIESNIEAWNQWFNPENDKAENLQHWVSITDKCSSFDDTEKMLRELNEAVWIRNAA